MRTLFLDCFHHCFVPEVRKYLAGKGLPFKVHLIMDSDRAKWSTFPQMQCLNSASRSGVIRTTEADHTVYSVESNGNTMEENPYREKIIKKLEGLHY